MARSTKIWRGVNLTIGFSGKKIAFNASVALGISLPMGNATANVNGALNVRNFGLGTSHGSTGKLKTNVEGVVSPSITVGGGQGVSIYLNTFSSTTASGISNDYKNSGTLGSNFVFGGNGKQQVGYAGGKFGNFQVGTYNDFIPVLGDGGDRWNTGGVGFQYGKSDGTSITAGTDVYTGRITEEDGIRQTQGDNIAGGKYGTYDQTGTQRELNNGQTFLKVTGQFGSGTVSTSGILGGKSQMYFQNALHNSRVFKNPLFYSTASGL